MQAGHDCNDERASKLLTSCRRSIRRAGRILVIEALRPPPNGTPAAVVDLLQLLLAGGRERTEQDFSALFEKSGFTLRAVHPMGDAAIVEGEPR